MNNKLSVLVKRYLVASFIAIIGLGMIFFGLRTHQDALFMVAAVNLFIGGILAILFSGGILKKNIVLAIGSLCIVITAITGYMSVKSVEDTIQHEEDYKVSSALNIYVLGEIRDIQRAYKATNKVYASNFDELKRFFENDKITKIDASGTVPSRKMTIPERDALYKDKRALDKNMTEREAALLVANGNPGNSADLINFKRDTIQVYYKDEFLASTTRQAARKSLGLGEFNFDELRYVPMTNPKEEWIIETVDKLPYLNGDTIATIHVYGHEAVPKFEGGKRNIIGFGNLKTSSDKGTWE
ncbi:MAG: hypothetical protein M9897_07070 [Brumimicrobium sp.]|nr:hypothetical protein [Brumimicrobium sp.]